MQSIFPIFSDFVDNFFVDDFSDFLTIIILFPYFIFM